MKTVEETISFCTKRVGEILKVYLPRAIGRSPAEALEILPAEFLWSIVAILDWRVALEFPVLHEEVWVDDVVIRSIDKVSTEEFVFSADMFLGNRKHKGGAMKGVPLTASLRLENEAAESLTYIMHAFSKDHDLRFELP